MPQSLITPEKFRELVPLGVCANGRTLNHEIALPSNLTERLQRIQNKVILADPSHGLLSVGHPVNIETAHSEQLGRVQHRTVHKGLSRI